LKTNKFHQENTLMSKPYFKKAKVIITGGLGFIGSNLARWLVDLGAVVTLVDSLVPEYGGNFRNITGIESLVRVNISDVRDEYGMNYLVQGQDYLFNLAGQTSHLDSMANPFIDLEINCRSQLAILEACRRHNPRIRIVFASTRQIYGRPQYLPVDETHPLVPVDINGINKIAGEMYHLLYSKVYGIPATSLRLTNTYGPRMRVKDARQTFLGIWVRRLLEGQPLLVFGDGKQVRDFTYVDDTVEALLCAAVAPQMAGNAYNLGADERVTLKDLAELLISCHGTGRYEIVPFPHDRKAIDIGDYYADDHRFRKTTGWRPVVSLADGLKRTLEYYKQELPHYV
jgi:UDP-glucose 4-epimerase